MAADVSFAKCDSYQAKELDDALRKCLYQLGGLQQFVKPGQKILIKPNILSALPAETATITHPALIAAVVKQVKELGAIPLVGDCPSNAHGSIDRTLAKTGIRQATESAGGQIVHLQSSGVVKIPSPSQNQRMKLLAISKLVLDVDAIINLPKLKTHNLTAYTGAIKNMFGVVPGFNKAQFHAAAIRPKDMSELLVDVYQIAKPTLNIMDAIVGMEGNGPAGGEPRKFGQLIASTDGVAMDTIGAYLIGFQPVKIPTTTIASNRGLGEADFDKIGIIGAKLDDLRQADWKHSMNKSTLANLLPEPIYNLLKPLTNQLRINPEINQSKCTQCLVCVKNCPAQTIDHFKDQELVKINLKNCINCYCCHEMCEYKAIDLKPTWLVRILRIPI